MHAQWSLAVILLLFIVLASSCVSAGDTTLRKVILVHRHGDRGPLATFPKTFNDLNQWPLGLGQLTGKGMYQTYTLGRNLNALYVNQTALLNPAYTYTQVKVRASAVDRCLMSGESVMYGLYPLGTGPVNEVDMMETLPSRFQPVPLKTVAVADEALLRPYDVCSMQVSAARQDHLYHTSMWKQTAESNAALLERISNVLGTTISLPTDDQTSINMYNAYDVIWTAMAHKYPLPSSLSGTDAADFLQLAQWVTGQEYTNANVLPLLCSNWFSEVQSILQTYVANPTKDTYRLHVYPAHDTTVLPICGALQVCPTDQVPPYASGVLLELHEQSPNTYTVRVVFNLWQGGSEPTPLPWCNNQIDCPLDQFNSFLSKFIMSDWNTVCDYDVPIVDYQWRTPAFVILGLGSLFFVVAILFIVLWIREFRRARKLEYAPVGNINRV